MPNTDCGSISRQYGDYPETGLEEINRDLLEADFWGVSRFHLSGQHVYRAF
jgi:hypothetical protein